MDPPARSPAYLCLEALVAPLAHSLRDSCDTPTFSRHCAACGSKCTDDPCIASLSGVDALSVGREAAIQLSAHGSRFISLLAALLALGLWTYGSKLIQSTVRAWFTWVSEVRAGLLDLG